MMMRGRCLIFLRDVDVFGKMWVFYQKLIAIGNTVYVIVGWLVGFTCVHLGQSISNPLYLKNYFTKTLFNFFFPNLFLMDINQVLNY
jgi:hypothetical protein